MTTPILPKITEYDGGTYKYATFKRDGFFVSLVGEFKGPVDEQKTNYSLRAYTRKEEITEYLEPMGWFQQLLEKKPLLTIYGELFLPGKNASQVITHLKTDPSWLQYDVFGIEQFPYGVPHEVIADQAHKLHLSHVPFVPFRSTLTDEPLPPYTEGYVFTNGQLCDMAKWKPVRTIDLVVTNWKHGKRKYLGTLGALICSTTEGDEVCSISGMTDPERQWFWENRTSLSGMVVEVAYQLVGDRGRLRHPRFIRTRPDKNENECSHNQDSDLAEYWNEKNANTKSK